MNRFDTDFGDDGLKPGKAGRQVNLWPFSATYRFMDRTWGITIWCLDWTDARHYCKTHGLTLFGIVEEIIEQ